TRLPMTKRGRIESSSSDRVSSRNRHLRLIVCCLLSVCPDREAGLQPWLPGHSEEHHVTIGSGQKVLLTASATVHSIRILNGGKLVVADSNRPILLRTRSILIGNDGELHVGSPDCPYRGNFTISLVGRYAGPPSRRPHLLIDQRLEPPHIHGRHKLSWTFLNATLHPGGGHHRSFLLRRSWGSRGVLVHVIHPDSGGVLQAERFDTHRSENESRRLAEFVGRVEAGLILVMLVNDEASKNLEESGRGGLSKLGSQHVQSVGFRCSASSVGKKVRSAPTWTLGMKASVSVDMLSGDSILELADEPLGWESGDRVVVASSDFSMHQAEEFILLPCPQCSEHQVKVKDKRVSAGILTSVFSLRGDHCTTVQLLTAGHPIQSSGCFFYNI
uniref:G8 domain-containing protein n=1 Tax=Oryzias melastigma TaxID=30732 RepID=A0A3B3CSE9_ORYME